jgi:(1->4)-alpha-D-glucan 1-alpha-D-glucosylmutase
VTASPLATYRLQFHPGFDFDDTRAILDYLRDLGISDIYASPIFQARTGSPHGYDVVDSHRINSQLGGEKSFIKLASELNKYQLGWIQDIVPNHMAFHPENNWLMDIFEKGRDSAYFDYFDIDWDHPYPGLRGRVLAPFLGKRYGDVLEEGGLYVKYAAGSLAVHYFDIHFPLKIESLSRVFKHNLDDLKNIMGEDHPDFVKFFGVLLVLDSYKNGGMLQGRDKQLNMIKVMMLELYRNNAQIRAHMDRNLRFFNQDSQSPVPFQKLDALLNDQVFRLSYWKTAMEEINYRRFFNINDLISLRIEEPDVFEDVHVLVADYLKKSVFSGLRIDHIDGLYNPAEYLKRLRQMAENKYIIVEKILESEERLPESFPVEGTTGYDWMNRINGIFCREDPKRLWKKLYSHFTGLNRPYSELVADKKRLIIGKNMAGDIDNLARRLKKVAEHHRSGQDFTMYGLKRALVEILARFTVYRTYHTSGSVREDDREVIRKSVKAACRHIPEMEHECTFIEQCLLMSWDQGWTNEMKQTGEDFAMKFQQYSGPVMAKGFEDTLLYVYHPLLSLNEVGGNPDRFGSDMPSFHAWNQARQQNHPVSLNASATHDNKRGEDVRARINVLSEMPEEWEQKIRLWNEMNLSNKSRVKGSLAPDANDEYLLYQTLIGTYPFDTGRIHQYHGRIKAYLIKAVREAKIHTAWLRPDQDYEKAFEVFFEKIMRPGNEFLRDFIPFQQRIAGYGLINSLAQVLLKMTQPGVPDFYQGCELWDFNLVDPDNRRPVDFECRRSILEKIKKDEGGSGHLKHLWEERRNGWIKLFLIWKTLKVRRKFPHVFEYGEYLPLRVAGRQKNSIIAFMRKKQSNWILVAVPRFLTGLIKENQVPAQARWDDTRILLPTKAPGQWDDVMPGRKKNFTGQIPAAGLFEHFPVSLFCSLSHSRAESVAAAGLRR